MECSIVALQAVTDLMAAQSLRVATGIFREALAGFGVAGHLFLRPGEMDTGGLQGSLLSNLPPSWLSFYLKGRRYLADPVIQRAMASPGSFFWSEAEEPGTPAAQALHMAAREAGLVDGFTVAGRHGTAVTVMSLSAPGPLCWNPLERGIVELLVTAMTAKLLAAPDYGAGNRASRLSAKEQAVLSLAASGQTDKQIARQMDVRPTTVQTYWARIRVKLAASNRANAVAIGVMNNDVLPRRAG